MSEKVILIIRDGWGYRQDTKDNAIANTPTPNTDKLMSAYPNTLLDASGRAVGLPPGYQGNSEVGHMAIGAGRIILQSMERINDSIKSGEFYENPAFLGAIENCKKHKTKLHMTGLLQSEGVHAQETHLHALLELCKRQDFKDVCVHVICDGRDAPVKDSIKHIKLLQQKIKEYGLGEISTVSGRYYTMDRNKTWDRTKKSYDCVVAAQTGRTYEDALKYAQDCHQKEETDEFIIPAKKKGYSGVKENDSFIFYNFRTDRTRQLTQAMVEDKFDGWNRKPLNIYFVAMTQFYKPMNAHIAYGEEKLEKLLGKMLSDAGKKQLRISETEKYAHVTFFFNGQVEKPNPGEEHALIPSPPVATYDLKPEMSVYEITERLTKEISSEKYDFIVTNLVNGDMVGHTGITPAIEKALASVDVCVGKIVDAGLAHGYTLLIFADHGNAEDQTPNWRTSHTTNPVPVILVSKNEKLAKVKLKKGKGLRDIAPTVLKLMGIEKPHEMTGESIIG